MTLYPPPAKPCLCRRLVAMVYGARYDAQYLLAGRDLDFVIGLAHVAILPHA